MNNFDCRQQSSFERFAFNHVERGTSIVEAIGPIGEGQFGPDQEDASVDLRGVSFDHGSRSLSVVMSEQAAQSPFAGNLTFSSYLHRLQRRVLLGLVGAVNVVEGNELRDDMVQMRFAKNDKMVQALNLKCLRPAFGIGVEVGTAKGQFADLGRLVLGSHIGSTRCCNDGIKLSGEFAVPVPQQVAELLVGLLEMDAKVTCLLGHPVGMRMSRGGSNPDAPRFDVNEKQQEVIHRPTKCPNFSGNKIAGPEGMGVALDELVPGTPLAFRVGIEALSLEQVLNRGATEAEDAQLLEFTQQTRVAPDIFARQTQDKRTDILSRSRPTAATRCGPLLPFSQPPGKGSRGNDRDQLFNGASEYPAIFEQPLLLRRRHSDCLGQPGTQDFVFDFEELDLSDQFFVRRMGQEHEQRSQELGQGGLRIGGSDDVLQIGGTDLTCIKDPVTGKPYIPGSSIKGKLRSSLERCRGLLGANPCGCADRTCPVCRVFGPHMKVNHELGPTRLMVFDAPLEGDFKIELKTESINRRDTGAAQHPRTLERVAAGARFKFKVALQFFDLDTDFEYTDADENRVTGKDALRNVVDHALGLMEDTGIGAGTGKGYGEIKLENIKYRWTNMKRHRVASAE